MSFTKLQNQVAEGLQQIMDPEINTVSIVDLGMVEKIEIGQREDGYTVNVILLPTFLGCPALGIIKGNIIKSLFALPEIASATVQYAYHPPWTSDRITPQGLQGLKAFGISAPPSINEEDGSWEAECPYCSSMYVTVDNLFGPTACRSILYCKNCKNPFEVMKPISNLM
ncbi:1,2-phenylacetyl-CoA epoxidase subunit PaaD [Bacillus testis]|uniref:1,2-phenylacetyl-CoA epoxidase subunit PaaD n=1 Tax=Bacillus testis TaxID=1622072 RepID=UPI00067EBE21|nr:1,2-phenylacetyl-CoA epoxidase subunit PaaD [Bacillus testis]